MGDLCTDGVTAALDNAWDATGGKVVSAVDDHSKGLAQIGTGIAFLGYAACPVTAGIGCTVGGAASAVSTGLYANAARHECGEAGIVSSRCGLAVMDTGLSAVGWRSPSRFALTGRGAHNAYAGMRTWMSKSFWNIGINGFLNFLGGVGHSLWGDESFFGMDC